MSFEATNEDVRMSKKQVALLTRVLMGALHWSFLDGMQAGEEDGRCKKKRQMAFSPSEISPHLGPSAFGLDPGALGGPLD